jgi:lysophospholipase L1-like esterase
MALVQMATQSWGWVTDTQGNGLPSATVTITNLDGSAATHYADLSRGSPLTSALTTNADGTLPRYLDGGPYNMSVNGGTARRIDAVSGLVESRVKRTVANNIVLVVGDSIPTQGAPVTANGVFTAGSLLMWANTAAGRRSWIPGAYTTNGVVSATGAKTADNLTSHLTPALKTRPGVMVIQAGVNDAVNAVTLAVTSANRQAMAEAALAQGIVPVLTTVTPVDGTTGTIRAAIAAINSWTVTYGAANDIPVCDFSGAVTDPVTGNSWRSGWTSDGTHPTSVGARALGATLAATLLDILPSRPFPMPLGSTDPRSLYVNPLMAGSGGFPTNWTYESGAATVSLVSGTADGVNGNWWRIVKTGTSNSC